MEAVIASFRRGRHKQTTNQMILKVGEVTSKEKAQKLVGKKVSWKTPSGKEINGEIVAAHGNSGAVRAKFEKGIPGQAIATKVKVA